MVNVHRFEFPGESGMRAFSDGYLVRHLELEDDPESVLQEARGLKPGERKTIRASLNCDGCWFPNLHLEFRRSDSGILEGALIGEKVGIAIGVQEYDLVFFGTEKKMMKYLGRWHRNHLKRVVGAGSR